MRAYIDAAAKIGTPYVRVLADLNPAPECEVDDAPVLGALEALVPFAEEKKVTLLVETNGVYSDTSRLRALLDRIASDCVAALWDVHHPFRFAGEKPETTVQNLGIYIKHVHIKDSVMTPDGGVEYRLMGEGDLPVDDIMRSLRSVNYEGFVSLEWVKRWMPDLCDAPIVIPHFMNFMSRYTDTPRSSGRLFDNNAGTGKYVWPKDTLIDLTFPQVLDRMVEEFPDQYAFRYTTLRLHPYLHGVPRRRGHLCPRAHLHGRQEGRPCRHMGDQRAAVVHHLLGHGEDRRGAGDREYRL